ncbi:protein lysine acetyltransferase [Shewanella sp. NFH-SH190041]|uniref:bifunctional acetate--CoA ligase family protein/GNAT family N-acetyltransferase n=1 Tax=Shewanella sp. NFH-SH190041 TaxID=2950245 RepID=UPI0021C3CA98|nr:bifunctional acetate--CoA ligase family protein/GNAT family N-acetyltransferase [Shewanella sp. NFH-SH190041]BDM64486.1 protein lysine acetyltransferase [Shewanella sp. NFH-SH190041]
MSLRTLSPLFNPSSVAVIGASIKPQRAGNAVIRNLITNGFSGPIMPVTAKYQAVLGILSYPSVEALPIKPDVAIICIRADNVPAVVETLAQYGCKAAIIMASGMEQVTSNGQTLLQQAMLAAKRFGMRLLGPNSLGMIIPAIGLNASLTHSAALPGKIAFISQSAAVCTTVLDWANHKGIGFSAFISMGESADIDVEELLDFLGRDPRTQAILLYLDGIKHSRRFVSAARTASRHKAIIVLKAGRQMRQVPLQAQATIGHDTVYDAAFRRAGMLRVQNLTELFAAVETLAHSAPIKGEKLAVLSNGNGPAQLAMDELLSRGGKMATLSPKTIEKLNQLLPVTWSGGNPVDIIGDADAKRYGAALDILLDAPELDAVLVLHAPSVLGNSSDIAHTVIDTAKRHQAGRILNILTTWSGEESAYPARKALSRAGIPTYRTPEGAIGAFMHMVEFRRNQKLLQQVPQSIPELSPALNQTAPQQARALLDQAIKLDKLQLETHDAAPILAAYGLHTIATRFAANSDEAVHIAQQLGYPVALKIQSPDLLHKSDVHGVVLNLNSAEEVQQAAQAMASRVRGADNNAQIQGILVQKMALTAGAQEIRVAVLNDPVFGPAICLGEGGSEWHPTRDGAVALPPLNMALARYLVIQALKSHKLHDRHLPRGLDMQALCLMLTRLSHLIIDCPQIASLDLNPVLAAGPQITLLDINLTLHAKPSDNAQRLAIMPYPKELEETAQLKDGRAITLRPILPEDEPQHHIFDSALSAEDRYKRYFGVRAPMTHEEMAVLTQIDYAREMAFIAIAHQHNGEELTLGAVRAAIDPDNTEAEFAMAVRSDQQGLGIGRLLLEKLIRYYRNNHTRVLTGFTMFENRNMASLAKSLGFSVSFDMEEQLIKMVLPLENKDKG